ncbi:response regulator [Luethyella okanaganae]|uniref:Response regulator n=1 Tax=Luethyella okanaganae TaxID=69372 RepID=A0ABW1VEE0_9MICO
MGAILVLQFLVESTRFSNTSWAEYLPLLYAVFNISAFCRPLVHRASLPVAAIYAVAVAFLLTLPALGQDGWPVFYSVESERAVQTPEGIDPGSTLLAAGLAVGAWCAGLAMRAARRTYEARLHAQRLERELTAAEEELIALSERDRLAQDVHDVMAHSLAVIAQADGIRMTGEGLAPATQPDFEFAGAAHDGAEIVDLAAEAHPDVILMDIRMPQTDGITATRQVLVASPRSRVIVLTTHQRQEAVAHTIDAGAHGFLMKDARPELLLAAIRTVHEGNSVYAPSTTLALIRDLTPAPRDEPDQQAIAALTTREREVYPLVARGLKC